MCQSPLPLGAGRFKAAMPPRYCRGDVSGTTKTSLRITFLLMRLFEPVQCRAERVRKAPQKGLPAVPRERCTPAVVVPGEACRRRVKPAAQRGAQFHGCGVGIQHRFALQLARRRAGLHPFAQRMRRVMWGALHLALRAHPVEKPTPHWPRNAHLAALI